MGLKIHVTHTPACGQIRTRTGWFEGENKNYVSAARMYFVRDPLRSRNASDFLGVFFPSQTGAAWNSGRQETVQLRFVIKPNGAPVALDDAAERGDNCVCANKTTDAAQRSTLIVLSQLQVVRKFRRSHACFLTSASFTRRSRALPLSSYLYSYTQSHTRVSAHIVLSTLRV